MRVLCKCTQLIKNNLHYYFLFLCIICDLFIFRDLIGYANSIISVILIPILYLFYKRTFYINNGKISKKYTVLPAILFSLFTVIGGSFDKYNSFTPLFSSPLSFFKTTIVLIGYFAFYYGAINLIFNKIAFRKEAHTVSIFEKNKFLNFIFYKRPFIASWIIFIITWSFYLVASFPGREMGDTYLQLQQFWGINSYAEQLGVTLLDPSVTITQHHPVIHTVFLGLCSKFGRFIGNESYGIFCYTLIQYLFVAASLAFLFCYIVRIKVPDWYKVIAILFIAFCPTFPIIATLITKDGFFASFMLIYVILFLQLIRNPNSILASPKRIISLAVIVLLCCLSRNNGIYSILLSFPFIILLYRKNKKFCKILLSVFLCSMTLFFAYANVLLPMLKITKGSIRETLSVPFQQTARYVKFHGDDVTKEEMEKIDKVLPYDKISDSYDPNLSDSVKDLFRKDATEKDLINYFTTWFEMFFKHPLTYVQATINNTYGYFYCCNYNFWLYPLSEVQSIQHKTIAHMADNYINEITKAPVVSLLFTAGIYSYMLILASAVILYKNRKYIIGFIPAYTILLACLLSPMNANQNGRYMWPIIFLIPLLIGICFINPKAQNTKETNKIVPCKFAGIK